MVGAETTFITPGAGREAAGAPPVGQRRAAECCGNGFL